MNESNLILGIDLGTSGVRIAIINSKAELIYFSSSNYLKGLSNSHDWEICCKLLINKIPNEIKIRLIACSIDGTSGTLMGCDYNGKQIGNALPYFKSCLENKAKILKLLGYTEEEFSAHSSVGRAYQLIDRFGDKILLRHQADWVSGWFLNDWTLGEEGNNIRMGWDLTKQAWSNKLENSPWFKCLPSIVPSGTIMGRIASIRAKELGLPNEIQIIAGTTDSNAAVLATDAKSSEGITVLGSTIVLKSFSNTPIKGAGISNHLVGGKWIVGGASNAGCGVLNKFFSSKDLVQLSRQIDPELDSGLNLRPLTCIGERFPINDPYLQPILEPRPISDSLYLHGLLEGLARIEAKGWEKLSKMNSKKPTRIITIGGGSKNPQWRKIRERLIGIPIKTCSKQPAEGIARLALQTIRGKKELS